MALTPVERLIALAGSERVGSYTRKSKTGKTIHVDAYTRSPGDMANAELFKEYKGLKGSAEPQDRNRFSQITNEIRKRQSAGQWGHSNQSAATKAVKKVEPASVAVQKRAHSTRKEFETNVKKPQEALKNDEYDAHVEKVRAILTDPKNAKYDTQRKHGIWAVDENGNSAPVPGLYTPERTEQHKKIISDILADHANVPREKQAVMSGGLGGAGKGYVLDKYADINESNYITIDPDQMKQELLTRGMVDEVPGLLPMEHAAFIHEESSDLANLLHQTAMNLGMNVVLDTTMASVGSTQKKVQKFKDQGYDVEAVFVDVPVEVSITSALGRHRGGVDRFRTGSTGKGGDLGGRFVPPEYLQGARPEPGSEYQSKNRAAFEEMKANGVFTRTRVYDNSDRTPGSSPKLVSDEVARAQSKQTADAVDQLRKKVKSPVKLIKPGDSMPKKKTAPPQKVALSAVERLLSLKMKD